MKLKVVDKDKQKIRKLKRELDNRRLAEKALRDSLPWIFITGMLTVWLAYGLGYFL